MKQFAIVFCLLAIATIANSLNLQHNADYHIESFPGHEDLISYIDKFSLGNTRIAFKGCNLNTASWHQSGNDVLIYAWISSRMFCYDNKDQEIS